MERVAKAGSTRTVPVPDLLASIDRSRLTRIISDVDEASSIRDRFAKRCLRRTPALTSETARTSSDNARFTKRSV